MLLAAGGRRRGRRRSRGLGCGCRGWSRRLRLQDVLQLLQDDAAIFVADREVQTKLVGKALELLKDTALQKKLSTNIGKRALLNADEVIAKEVLKISL